MNENFREELARALCVSAGIDTDKTGYGLGINMPKDATYPLWHYQLKAADVAINVLTTLSK